jgi:hypothetical protein
MDRNIMTACEGGMSFLETFPLSSAAAPLAAIVDKIVAKCSAQESCKDSDVMEVGDTSGASTN